MALSVLPLPGSDHQRLLVSAAVEAGQLLGFDSSNWVLADANATAAIRAEWIAVQSGASGSWLAVCKRAIFYDPTGPYTKGALQFLSATAGGVTETNPGAADVAVQVMGRALSTDEAYIDCDVRHVYVTANLVGTQPATAANYEAFFIANEPLELVFVQESHRVAGSNGSPVTLDIEKLTGTTALDSGVAMLASTFNLKGTADTVQAQTPTATAANRRLDVGDRMALKDSGTLTAVAGLTVTCVLTPQL